MDIANIEWSRVRGIIEANDVNLMRDRRLAETRAELFHTNRAIRGEIAQLEEDLRFPDRREGSQARLKEKRAERDRLEDGLRQASRSLADSTARGASMRQLLDRTKEFLGAYPERRIPADVHHALFGRGW